MNAPGVFSSTHQAVRSLAQEIVTKTGEVVEMAVRMRQLRSRAAWVGYVIIECAPGQFAIINRKSEFDRYPNSGTIDLETVEKFFRAREAEPVW